jgi:hypothetical protein
MPFDYALHTFHSQQFRSVVIEAVEFLRSTPVHALPPVNRFIGSGVYALYYQGRFDLYAEIARRNSAACTQPIYVGKAVPPGWRIARARESESATLYGRLREHGRSIRHAENLDLNDFRCQLMILRDTESDLLVPVEAELIRRHRPLWNSVVDGFGNHDPGKGRYNQARSEWDILHPGRPWVYRLTGESAALEDVIREVRGFLDQSGLS